MVCLPKNHFVTFSIELVYAYQMLVHISYSRSMSVNQRICCNLLFETHSIARSSI